MNNHLIQDLAKGPLNTVNVYTGYYVNGYKFHTEGRSANRMTVNCGVCIKGTNYSDQSSDYYGKLIEVLEVEYPTLPIKRTVLFHCEWFDPTPNVGVKIHLMYNIVDVNQRRRFHKYEPFVLASQAQQVYYISYPSLRRVRSD